MSVSLEAGPPNAGAPAAGAASAGSRETGVPRAGPQQPRASRSVTPRRGPTTAFWDHRAETLPRKELEALQLVRLQRTVRRVAQHVPFYRDRLRANRVDASALRTFDDVRRLPFTTSADLRNEYPDGFVIRDRGQPLRLHTSSGTTGKPKALFFSRRDLDHGARLIARCLTMAGCTREDVLQNMMTYGMFTGALVMHYGAEKAGMMVIPAGPGNSERQLLLMRDFGSTVIHTTPSYALYFAGFLERQGVDPRRELRLRKGLIGAEAYCEETRARIEAALGIEVYNSYGLAEMNGPGVAFECPQRSGLHLWEDSYLIEVIDSASCEPLPDGERGELVLTTLAREAMPLLRYRTRDLTAVHRASCACGRTHARIERIAGRTDDMLVVRGVNLTVQQVERTLMRFPEVGRNYLIRLEGLDEMIVQAEVATCAADAGRDALQQLGARIADALRAEIQVRPRIELVAPGTLPVSEGKAKRVIDERRL
jgi:phenylacetate-CoA ligase